MLGLQMVTKARATGEVRGMIANLPARQAPPPTWFATGSACLSIQGVFLAKRCHDAQKFWRLIKVIVKIIVMKGVNDPVTLAYKSPMTIIIY